MEENTVVTMESWYIEYWLGLQREEALDAIALVVEGSGGAAGGAGAASRDNIRGTDAFVRIIDNAVESSKAVIRDAMSLPRDELLRRVQADYRDHEETEERLSRMSAFFLGLPSESPLDEDFFYKNVASAHVRIKFESIKIVHPNLNDQLVWEIIKEEVAALFPFVRPFVRPFARRV